MSPPSNGRDDAVGQPPRHRLVRVKVGIFRGFRVDFFYAVAGVLSDDFGGGLDDIDDDNIVISDEDVAFEQDVMADLDELDKLAGLDEDDK